VVKVQEPVVEKVELGAVVAVLQVPVDIVFAHNVE